MITIFFIRAVLAGVGIAVMAGPIGCFVVWRRMAYFGETLAHATLLGISLSMVAGYMSYLFIFLILGGLVLFLAVIKRFDTLPIDTVLGGVSHFCLALGLIVFSLSPSQQFMSNMTTLFFGEILTVSWLDVITIFISALLLLLMVILNWRRLIILCLHQDIAVTMGISPFKTNIILLALLASAIALMVKMVGVLLVVSLLLIPAATAKLLSHSPKQMAYLAPILGVSAVVVGMFLTFYFDLPTGPTIILVSGILFLGFFLLQLLLSYIRFMFRNTQGKID